MTQITATLLIDTVSLTNDFPWGTQSLLGNVHRFDPYFKIAVEPGYSYTEYSARPSQGIQCKVGDTIHWNARSSTDQNKFVIINEFGDRMQKADETADLTKDPLLYLTEPEFIPLFVSGLKYPLTQKSHLVSDTPRGWRFWRTPLEDDGTVHMNVTSITARQSTGAEHIEYTFGVCLFSQGAWRSFVFDPAIKISQ